MARNISFMLTTEQVRKQQKTVTRRLGWLMLKQGDELNACVKCMGLKQGEKIERLAKIRVVDVRRERLYDITPDDVIREGFEGQSVEWFIDMFMREMGVPSSAEVTRIEFEYINPSTPANKACSGLALPSAKLSGLAQVANR